MRNIDLDLGTSWYSIGRPEEPKIYDSIKTVDNTFNLMEIPLKLTKKI